MKRLCSGGSRRGSPTASRRSFCASKAFRVFSSRQAAADVDLCGQLVERPELLLGRHQVDHAPVGKDNVVLGEKRGMPIELDRVADLELRSDARPRRPRAALDHLRHVVNACEAGGREFFASSMQLRPLPQPTLSTSTFALLVESCRPERARQRRYFERLDRRGLRRRLEARPMRLGEPLPVLLHVGGTHSYSQSSAWTPSPSSISRVALRPTSAFSSRGRRCAACPAAAPRR